MSYNFDLVEFRDYLINEYQLELIRIESSDLEFGLSRDVQFIITITGLIDDMEKMQDDVVRFQKARQLRNDNPTLMAAYKEYKLLEKLLMNDEDIK